MKTGDYITYDSKVHGSGHGQVVDVVSRGSGPVVLVEPLYTGKRYSSEERESILIELRPQDCKADEGVSLLLRMRFR